MNAAKIRLSAKEMELIGNADWILTKNGILKKVQELLGGLLQEQQSVIANYKPSLPAEVVAISPKISKGENYKGLPYLVLDHPRYFDKENSLAIRSMFWWGNFFSTTLHISGSYKRRFEQNILGHLALLKEESLFICTNNEEWEHHFEAGNYAAINSLPNEALNKLVTEKRFLKLAYHIPLQQWDDALELLQDHFNKLLKLLVD
ncbi:MAG TPA: hypothetical protein VF476_00870 [Chitinophagaceae bacterium]